MEEPMNTIDEKTFRLDKVFDVVYLVLFVALIAVGLYVFDFHAEDYDTATLVKISYFYVPAAFFSVTGMLSVKSSRSLLYAVLAAIVSIPLLVLFYAEIFPLIQ